MGSNAMLDQPLANALNSATQGAELARAVLERLAAGGLVKIDASQAHRMTPSFANAFAMTVLERVPDAFSARKVHVVAAAQVVAALEAAVDRYERGIRLSTQPAA